MDLQDITDHQPLPHPHTDTESEVRQMLKRFAEAVRYGKVSEIMLFYTTDIVAFDIMPPLQNKGRDQYRKAWQSYADNSKVPMAYDFVDLKIHTSQDHDHAFGFGVLHMHGQTKDEKKIDMLLRYTAGYQRINGKWLICHEHTSVPIDMESQKPQWN